MRTPRWLNSLRLQPGPAAREAIFRSAAVTARRTVAGLWIVLLLCLGSNLTTARAADPSDPDPPSAPQVEPTASNQPKGIDYGSSVKTQLSAITDREPRHAPTRAPSVLEALGYTIAGALIWRLIASHVATFLCWRFNSWTEQRRNLADQLAEQKSFEAFAANFQRHAAARSQSRSAAPAQAAEPVHVAEPIHAAKIFRPLEKVLKPEPQPDPLEIIFREALEDINSVRKLLGRVAWCRDEAEKRPILEDLSSRIRAFKDVADLPELKPLWQVSATLEALLNHLAAKPDKLTPSCLRSVVSALDLLADLCVPGIRPSLATEPPVRLLAVDDDAISRIAISNALKQVFSPPEIAVDGPSGLELAAGGKFDVIFLDIEMPGMNGFELCAKLRQMPEHQATPILFVTTHGDFNARAQLPLVGAQDLIAKPFLSFEVALKSLTFVLRGRLSGGQKSAEPAEKSSPITDSSPATTASAAAPPEPIRLPSPAFASTRVLQRS